MVSKMNLCIFILRRKSNIHFIIGCDYPKYNKIGFETTSGRGNETENIQRALTFPIA